MSELPGMSADSEAVKRIRPMSGVTGESEAETKVSMCESRRESEWS